MGAPAAYLLGTKVDGVWHGNCADLARFAAARTQVKAGPACDLTLSPPKSVSLLWAFADAAGKRRSAKHTKKPLTTSCATTTTPTAPAHIHRVEENGLVTGFDTAVPTVPTEQIENVLAARPSLSGEQAEMVLSPSRRRRRRLPGTARSWFDVPD